MHLVYVCMYVLYMYVCMYVCVYVCVYVCLYIQLFINIYLYHTDKGAMPLSDTRTIGFRTIALVTDDDSDPARLANLTGSGSLTTRYRVNGASIWARGSNLIPLDEFAGRVDAAALVRHVRSA